MLIGLAGGIPFQYSKSITGQIAALFAQGEKGVHFDPSDITTLFQDNAGTIPVTAVGQTVGLMLDKSNGLVLGPELVINGGLADGTGWTPGTGWTIGSGVASVVAASGTVLRQAKTITAGKAYQVQFDITSYTAGTIYVQFATAGSQAGPNFTSAGTKSCILIANANYTNFDIGALAGTTASVDNISVKELPGYHATQATSTARPILGRHPITGRRNLLTYTEANATIPTEWTAPGGTGTRSLVTLQNGKGGLRFQATAERPFISYAITLLPSTTYTLSMYVDGGGTSSGNILAIYGLTDATGTTAALYTSAVNGRISITFTTGTVVAATIRYGLGCDSPVTGDINAGAISLEVGTSTTAYQKVTSTYDCTEAGVNDAYYLKFDGVDDFMVTPSIDFSGTDKMSVFAGVRKLSDAALAVAVELGSGSLAGSFNLLAPYQASIAGLRFNSRGTLSSDAQSTGFSAPYTAVMAGQGGISTDQAVLRVNGAQVAYSVADQGTGNFGNYPLYIGMRGGTSLPFNGHLYSLIVRGALSDSSQISAGEVYCNSKTGAY